MCKITLCDNDSRVVDARSLLESWQLITKAIPDWCLKIIKNPRLRPNSILPTQGGGIPATTYPRPHNTRGPVVPNISTRLLPSRKGLERPPLNQRPTGRISVLG